MINVIAGNGYIQGFLIFTAQPEFLCNNLGLPMVAYKIDCARCTILVCSI